MPLAHLAGALYERALSSTHLKEIAEQAHQLKGAAASIAAEALAEAAHVLETAGHESQAETAPLGAHLPPIERASQALQALQAY